MTEFRYFAEPHSATASTWTEEPRECGICGEARPRYSGPFYFFRCTLCGTPVLWWDVA